MDKPVLILLIGLSGSGKSTVAVELAEKYDAAIISSDELRGQLCGDVNDQSKNIEVFQLFHTLIKNALENGNSVIADATNISIWTRAAILGLTKKLDVYKIAYIVGKPFNQCLLDNDSREKSIPDEVILRQVLKFQVPFYEEGFDKIIVHDTCNRPDKYYELLHMMTNFDQKNPHHTKTLGDHCFVAANKFGLSYGKAKQPEHSGLLIGARLHDVGKTATQEIGEDGIAHYYQHHNVGSYMILTEMQPLPNWTTDDLLECCFLINYHMMPFDWKHEKTQKKWRKIFGNEKYEMLLKFHEADKAAR